jgi:uncharacterized membrane protein YvlD (DUF360 family)
MTGMHRPAVRMRHDERMIRLLTRLVLALAGNAIGLWLAALLLDDMEIDGAAFVVAVLIFSVLFAVLEPLIQKQALKNTEALQGSSALITTLVALILTNLISDGLSISGLGTWILATVIVWLGTIIAGVLLARFVLKQAADDAKS